MYDPEDLVKSQSSEATDAGDGRGLSNHFRLRLTMSWRLSISSACQQKICWRHLAALPGLEELPSRIGLCMWALQQFIGGNRSCFYTACDHRPSESLRNSLDPASAPRPRPNRSSHADGPSPSSTYPALSLDAEAGCGLSHEALRAQRREAPESGSGNRAVVV